MVLSAHLGNATWQCRRIAEEAPFRVEAPTGDDACERVVFEGGEWCARLQALDQQKTVFRIAVDHPNRSLTIEMAQRQDLAGQLRIGNARLEHPGFAVWPIRRGGVVVG